MRLQMFLLFSLFFAGCGPSSASPHEPASATFSELSTVARAVALRRLASPTLVTWLITSFASLAAPQCICTDFNWALIVLPIFARVSGRRLASEAILWDLNVTTSFGRVSLGHGMHRRFSATCVAIESARFCNRALPDPVFTKVGRTDNASHTDSSKSSSPPVAVPPPIVKTNRGTTKSIARR